MAKRDAAFDNGDSLSDAKIQRQYGINPDPMGDDGFLIVDGHAQTAKYSGSQKRKSTTTQTGMGENGSH